MSKKPQSKDEALEALDFIVNVLKEHEKDLDRLINELGSVTEQFGETSELNCKVDKIEDKLGGLQGEISNLINYLSETPKEAPKEVPIPMPVPVKESKVAVETSAMRSIPVVLKCKQWEDFLALAFGAETLSFMYKEAEKAFQVDAVKGNQVLTYSGELPKLVMLLKSWLSKKLDVPERNVLEGVMALG